MSNYLSLPSSGETTVLPPFCFFTEVKHGVVIALLLVHRNDDHEAHKVKPALVKTLKDLGLDYLDLFLVQPVSKLDAVVLCCPIAERHSSKCLFG